jgi:hypothetical protein
MGAKLRPLLVMLVFLFVGFVVACVYAASHADYCSPSEEFVPFHVVVLP